MPFYKYRTDQNNTIIAKSDTSFNLGVNEAQVETLFEIPLIQPLFLYKVSGGVVVENVDNDINTFIESTVPPSEVTPTVQIFKYNAGLPPTIKLNRKRFIGQATTNGSGVATFEATLDGLSTGLPIFTTIDSIIATAQNNTAVVGNVPIASVKAITNGKSITVNVVESAGILVGGQGLEFSGSGITVYLQVEGT